jgi:cytoskeletal protein RodZ
MATTLALFALLVFVVPGGVLQTITTQSALAQNLIDADTLTQTITDEVEQEIEQEAEQEAEQDQDQTQSNEQSAEQSNTADVSQDETNEQANVLTTGDNTASTTQVGDNDAVGNEVEAESEGGDSGDAEAKKHSKAESSGGDGGDASGSINQDVTNVATTIQDSSADGNILSNENTFGDDVAIVDQDNLADQDAANIGIQDQDLTQTIDQVQDALNLNLDFDFQYGFQLDD